MKHTRVAEGAGYWFTAHLYILDLMVGMTHHKKCSGRQKKTVYPLKDFINEDTINEDPINKDPVNKAPINKDAINKDPINKDPINKDPRCLINSNK